MKNKKSKITIIWNYYEYEYPKTEIICDDSDIHMIVDIYSSKVNILKIIIERGIEEEE